MPKPRFTCVKQKGIADCGIACLATLFSLPYDKVFATACSVAPRCYERGLFEAEMLRIAAKLKIKLRRVRKFDTKKSAGILGVLFRKHHKKGEFRGCRKGHFVVLYKGLIFDPDSGQIWKPMHYVKAEGVKEFDSFLVRE